MFEIDFQHKTPTSLITINAKSLIIPAKKLLDFEDKCTFDKLCKTGCLNFNNKWSCPPFSPSYSELSANYSNLLLILLFCNLEQFNYIKNGYTKVRAGNIILKSIVDRFLRSLEKTFGGIMISNGSCRLCKPCTRKTNLDKCKKITEMRYSMESLGLNVIKISTDLFNHKLLWYRNKTTPPYTSVISGLLTNYNFDLQYEQSILEKLESHDFC
jgi:predicted metal-binding protein